MFVNKVVLITGASSGIGAACAQYFAKQNALLALVGRNAEKFNDVLAEIKQNGATTEPLVIIADVCTDAKRIISETIDKYQRLDVLVNNAGRGAVGGIETTSLETFDTIMTTNLRSVFELTQQAVPHLVATKGNVVNVSSTASFLPYLDSLAYCSSKGALDQLTKCTALELGPRGVRVNSVNPGDIITKYHVPLGMSESEHKDYVEKYNKIYPLRRVGQPHEVAATIGFLASDMASFITGTCLIIDGGLSLYTP